MYVCAYGEEWLLAGIRTEEVQSRRVCLDIGGHIGEGREGDKEGSNGTGLGLLVVLLCVLMLFSFCNNTYVPLFV